MADNSIDILITAVNQTQPAIKQIKQDLAGFKDSFNTVRGGINEASSAIERMAGLVQTLGQGFILLKSVDIFKGLASQAAEVERLGTVLHTVAANAGITASQIDTADKAIQKLGITAASSRQSLSQFVQAGLKVEDAARLARASQDLAVISGENSSQTFMGLTQAIEQTSIMMLRWRGIMVTNEEAQSRYAATNGKSVAALADWEKKQALLEMTLLKATRLTGIYEAAMGDVGKQYASLERYQQDAMVALGNGLTPAFSEAVLQLTQFLRFIKLTADESNNTTTSARSLGDAVKSIGGGIKESLIYLIQHRDLILGIGKAYVAVKAVSLASTIGQKIATTATGMRDAGKATISAVSDRGGVAAIASGKAIDAQAAANIRLIKTNMAVAASEAEVAASKASTTVATLEKIATDKAAEAVVVTKIQGNAALIASLNAEAAAATKAAIAERERAASAAVSVAATRAQTAANLAEAESTAAKTLANKGNIFANIASGLTGAFTAAGGFWGILKNIGTTLLGVVSTAFRMLGGLPGLILGGVAAWLIWGDGLKKIGSVLDWLDTKFKNSLDHVKSFFKALSGDSSGAVDSAASAAKRQDEYSQRAEQREKENTPEYKDYSAAVDERYKKEADLLELEYQLAQQAEKKLGSYSSADQKAAEEMKKRITAAKAEVAVAQELAEAKAKENKISVSQQDLLKSQKDREAFRKGEEYRKTQQVNDVFMARQNIGETKQVYGMGAPISMEMGNAISAVRKEFEAYAQNLEGADTNIYRLTYAWEHFIKTSKTTNEAIVGMAEFNKAIDEAKQRVATLQLLIKEGFGTKDKKTGAMVDVENPYTNPNEVSKKRAFDTAKKQLREAQLNSTDTAENVSQKYLAEALRTSKAFEEYLNPAPIFERELKRVLSDGAAAMQYFEGLITRGKVKQTDADKMQGWEKIKFARAQAQQEYTKLASEPASKGQMAMDEEVFRRISNAMQEVTKGTEGWAKALDRVQGLMATLQGMRASVANDPFSKVGTPSTVAAGQAVRRAEETYARDMAALEMRRSRGKQWVKAEEKSTAAGGIEDSRKAEQAQADAAIKRDVERVRNYKKTAEDEIAVARGTAKASTFKTENLAEEKAQREKENLENRVSFRVPAAGANDAGVISREDLMDRRQKVLDAKKLIEEERAVVDEAGNFLGTEKVVRSAKNLSITEAGRIGKEEQAVFGSHIGDDAGLLKQEMEGKGKGAAYARELEIAEQKRILEKNKTGGADSPNLGVLEVKKIEDRVRALAEENKALEDQHSIFALTKEDKERIQTIDIKEQNAIKEKVKTDKAAQVEAEMLVTNRNKGAGAAGTAEETAKEQSRGYDQQINQEKIKINQKLFDAYMQQLDAYVTAYKGKIEALKDVHKGTIDFRMQMAQMVSGDVISKEQQKIAPNKAAIGQQEALQTTTKLEGTSAKYDVEMASFNKFQEFKKQGILNSSRTEQEKIEAVSALDAESVSKRLEISRSYFTQLSQQRDEAKAKHKQYADEVVNLEKEIRNTVIEANASMRETARATLDPHLQYQDKKKDMQEYIDKAKEAAQAGDYEYAKDMAKKAQGAAKGLSGAEGANSKYESQADSLKGQSEATSVLVGIMQTQKGVAEKNREAQLATINDVTDAMNNLGGQIKALSTESEIKLNVAVDEQKIKELQDKLKNVIVDQENTVKVILDDPSVKGLRDQITAAISTEPYTIKVKYEGDTPASGGTAKVAATEQAEGGLIQGIGTGTSDSIPAQLSHGEFVVKEKAVSHYGANFLELLNSKALKFANGGLVGLAEGGEAPKKKSVMERLFGLFSKDKKEPDPRGLVEAAVTQAEDRGSVMERRLKEAGAASGGLIQHFEEGGEAKKKSTLDRLLSVFKGKDKKEPDPKGLVEAAVTQAEERGSVMERRLKEAGAASGGLIQLLAFGGVSGQPGDAAKAAEKRRQLDNNVKKIEAKQRVDAAKREGRTPSKDDLALLQGIPALSKEELSRRSARVSDKKEGESTSTSNYNAAAPVNRVAGAVDTSADNLSPSDRAKLGWKKVSSVASDLFGGNATFADGGEVDKEKKAKEISDGFKKSTGSSSLPTVDDILKVLGVGKEKKDPKKMSEFDGSQQTIGIRGATGGMVNALVSNGEFRLSPDAVNHYGAGLMHSVNDMTFPRFAEGGIAGTAASALGENKPAKDAPVVDIVKFVMEHKQKTHELTGSRENVYGLVNAIREMSAGNLG